MPRLAPWWAVVAIALVFPGIATAAAEAAADSGADADAEQDDELSLELDIEGIDDPLLENVRRFLTISELTEPGLLSRLDPRDSDEAEFTVADLRRRHRAAPGQIREALMPYGYYRPQIDASLERTGDNYRARYVIEPGEPARLTSVDVRAEGPGADFPAVMELLEDAELEEGDRLVHSRYQTVKQQLFDAAYDHGFLDARWRESEIRVAPDRLSASIDLVLDTGPRFYFGDVSVRQDVLAPDFVGRFVNIEPGEPYDVAELLELQRSLSAPGYFSRVEIRAPRQAAGDDHRVPVTVLTEPAKPQKYTLGLGYGTDTGPRAKLGVLLRRVNSRGHRLHADLQWSTIEQAVGLRYEIPIRNVATDSLNFTATGRQEEVGDADTEQVSLGVSQVVSWHGFRRRLYLQAERENFDFGDGPSVESDLVYPGITLTRDRADDLQYPRRGYGLRADLRTGVEALLSDVSFTRLMLNANWTRGIASKTRLLTRLEAGWLWTDDFGLLPPHQRFFAGGDRSVRGYAYQQIGPQNADGDVIGGKRVLSGSVELEHLFYGNYGAALFVDAGDAFDESPDLKVGAGAGFRWRSPIGMVRFDVAHPFDDEDDYRIHLTLGMAL